MKYFLTPLEYNLEDQFIKKDHLYIDLKGDRQWEKIELLARSNFQFGYYLLPKLEKEKLFDIVFSYKQEDFLIYIPRRTAFNCIENKLYKKWRRPTDKDHNFYGAISYLFYSYPYELLDVIEQKLREGFNLESVVELLKIELSADESVIKKMQEGLQKDLVLRWRKINGNRD